MLSDRLKELRKEKNNMTQDDLARALNISQSTITMIETNRRKASNTLILQLANFFDCSVDYLLGHSDVKNVTLNKLAVDEQIDIPIIGTVKAGIDGLAFEDYLGSEKADKNSVNGGGKYFYLKIKGDSMINEGILPGDLALVREQNDVEYGELAIILVDDEEGTIKRVYKNSGSITLQGANPKYPPRTFTGEDMKKVKIIGKVKELKRKF